MTRSRSGFPIVGVVLVVALFSVAAASGKSGGMDRPFKFHGTGTADVNLATGQLTSAATGQGSHVGLFNESEPAQVVPIGPGVFSYNSTWTLTAANGDRISGNCSGESTTPDGGVNVLTSLDCVVASGTGRFDDVRGNFHLEVDATLVSGASHYVTQFSGNGKISY
jgi:hypothetical protein